MSERLRIASEQLAALNSCENVGGTAESRAKWALEEADALLAAAGEQEAFSGPDFYKSMVRYRDEALAQLARAEAAELRLGVMTASERAGKYQQQIAAREVAIGEMQDFLCRVSCLMWGGELGWTDDGGIARMGDELKRRLDEVAALKAELAKYTEPLTDKQRSSLFGDINFCLAIDTDNLDMIDAAIRRVRKGE